VAVPVYQFDEFQLDCGRFELLRGGRPVRLERKPMELLILLLASDGQLVTRTEIAERLWSKQVFVDTEHGINTAIRKIRRVLGDDSEYPRFVQTVTGKGYRFSPPVLTNPPFDKPPEPTPSAPSPRLRKLAVWSITAAVCAISAIFGIAFFHSGQSTAQVTFTQLTDFMDSAVAPAVSPDGRMVAFIRGSNPFLSSDPIYLKMLPDGEARRLTDDDRPKYGLAFSPDGSEITYTALASGFATYSVPVSGGEPRLLLNNAAGLAWLSPHKFLFSEVKSGVHMGIVTASELRSGLREVYFPSHERGMAHYSYPSPNRHWALVVEMEGDGNWGQCRLVSLVGHNSTRSVGPTGPCTSAGWSPDGSWMYFTAAVEGSSHLWRQRFPDGAPQQITFGPTEEEGVAVEPSGRSLITSAGVYESAVWIHDPAGDWPLSAEGKVVNAGSAPSFNSDDSVIYYLWRPGQDSGVELWRTSLKSGRGEAVLPGVAMTAYDVSSDGKQVVYSTAVPGGTTQLWLASLDRGSPPQRFGGSGGTYPHFGPRGKILFQQTDGKTNYLEQMNPDGSNRSKVIPYPILNFQGVSPGRQWVMAEVPRAPRDLGPTVLAIPMDGGSPRTVCASYCVPTWSTNGRFLFVQVEPASSTSPGRNLAIPVGPGENLSNLPPGGIAPPAESGVVKGSQSIPRGDLVPGRDPEHFAYVNTTTHRNLYRVSLH
jgi:DNA-binding winged helix-turn-helix (wHTH) protein/Tol biopolymer transport system component